MLPTRASCKHGRRLINWTIFSPLQPGLVDGFIVSSQDRIPEGSTEERFDHRSNLPEAPRRREPGLGTSLDGFKTCTRSTDHSACPGVYPKHFIGCTKLSPSHLHLPIYFTSLESASTGLHKRPHPNRSNLRTCLPSESRLRCALLGRVPPLANIVVCQMSCERDRRQLLREPG